MKLGINTFFLMKLGFERSLQYAHDLGLRAVEVGALGPAARKFCDLDKLIADKGERQRWLDAYAKHGLEITSFSGHGAPLSPDKQIAKQYRQQFRQRCKLMELIGVKHMTLVAGLPEGAEGDKCPVWITQQTDQSFFRHALAWQWEKRLIPYWKEQRKIAKDHGVTLCFEMQVGDMIHNPVKLKRFHEEIGPVVACNFDVSHMWAQGIDPIEALRYLNGLVQHVHVKDTLIHDTNARLLGLNDTTPPTQPAERAWTFTLPGWGHDERTWREIVGTLRLIGYEGMLSLEMECEYISIEEGFEKSVAFLRPIVIEKPTGVRWWEAAQSDEFGLQPKET